jgi:Protein of unknown function (DUF2934)
MVGSCQGACPVIPSLDTGLWFQQLENRIRERAYEMWTAHGCVHGQAEQHWLAAEREVLATSTAVLAGKPNPKKKPRSSAGSKTARTLTRAG